VATEITEVVEGKENGMMRRAVLFCFCGSPLSSTTSVISVMARCPRRQPRRWPRPPL